MIGFCQSFLWISGINYNCKSNNNNNSKSKNKKKNKTSSIPQSVVDDSKKYGLWWQYRVRCSLSRTFCLSRVFYDRGISWNVFFFLKLLKTLCSSLFLFQNNKKRWYTTTHSHETNFDQWFCCDPNEDLTTE